jgi:hypothetical protein
MRKLISSGGSAEEIRVAWSKVASHVGEYAPDLAKAISEYLREAKDREAVQKSLNAFIANIPPGYYTPEKLLRTLERVKKTGVEGIVIFSAGGISSARLWDAVEKFFSE